jgi:hypothetical protein
MAENPSHAAYCGHLHGLYVGRQITRAQRIRVNGGAGILSGAQDHTSGLRAEGDTRKRWGLAERQGMNEYRSLVPESTRD